MKRKIIMSMISVIVFTGLTMFIYSCSKKEDPETPAPKPVATSIQIVSGGGQTNDVGGTLANSVEVIVKDQDGKAFQGSVVTFTVTEGSVSSGTKTTDASGKASITWTLGSTVGVQTLTAKAFKADGTTALSGSPITVSATATAIIMIANSIVLTSGGNQTADIGETLVQPVKVMVKNQSGTAFQGATVNFSVTEGAVSSPTGITDVSGYATVYWTLGTTVGTQTLTVTAFKSDGTTALTGSPITVSATADPIIIPGSIELVSGGDQTAQAGGVLADDIIVRVKDSNGNIFQNATVYYSVTEGGVGPLGGSHLTDGAGLVKITWALGPTEGTQTLTITAFKADGTTHLTGSPLTVNATAIIANSIELVSGGDQTQIIGITLTDPVEILVKDKLGNPFNGATVNFSVAEGSVSQSSRITDVSGKVSITWTLGTTEGTQTLTVTSYQADGTTPLTGSPLSVTATGEKVAAPDPVSDFDLNVYQTVKIGDQIWMAENLNSSHYSDGTAIPLISNNAAWGALGDNSTDKAYSYYNDIVSSEYGVLYTWAAAMNGSASSATDPSGVQGVCPVGWHLPSGAEWNILLNYLGGYASSGGKLRETGTTHWEAPNTGATNISGFTAFGGGYRLTDGAFLNFKKAARFWEATENGVNQAGARQIGSTNNMVYPNSYYKSGGLSVRCVKD